MTIMNTGVNGTGRAGGGLVARLVPHDGGGLFEIGGVLVSVDGDRYRWVRPTFDVAHGELRGIVRQTAAVVSARLSESGTTGSGTDAEMVRAATETQAVLTVFNEQRVAAGHSPLSGGCVEECRRMVLDRVFALAELSPWWRNDAVENIDVNGHTQAVVTFTGGVKVWIGDVAESGDDLVDNLRNAARRLGLSEQGFDAANSYVEVQLADGSRLTATFGGPRQAGVGIAPYANIRRHRHVDTTSDELVELGLLPRDANELICAWVRAGGNLIVGGDHNAGKTTALRSWAFEIQPWHRVITVESGLTELGLERSGERNVAVLHSRRANSEGEGEVTVGDLIEGPTRRLNPTRVIAGEVNNGNEVIPILDWMTASTTGSMFTIHARSAFAVVDRLETYAMRATPPQDPALVRAMVIEACPLIVHIAADETTHGRIDRYVTSIVEVVGRDRTSGVDSVLINELWTLAPRPAHNPVNPTSPTLVPASKPSEAACAMLARNGWVWARDGWPGALP